MKSNKQNKRKFEELLPKLLSAVFALLLTANLAFGQVKHTYSIDVFGGIGDKYLIADIGDTIEFINGYVDQKIFKYSINGAPDEVVMANIPLGDTIKTFVIDEDTTVLQNIRIVLLTDINMYINLTIDYNDPSSIKETAAKKHYNTIVDNRLLLTQSHYTDLFVYDTAGTFVKKTSIVNNTANLADLTTGLYFVTLTDENKNVVSFKIVKE